MQNRLYDDTAKVHVKGILGVLLGGWFLQKWETGFEHRDIVCFAKQNERGLMHTETVCLISY